MTRDERDLWLKTQMRGNKNTCVRFLPSYSNERHGRICEILAHALEYAANRFAIYNDLDHDDYVCAFWVLQHAYNRLDPELGDQIELDLKTP
jgi:hypothetical protein